MLNVSSSHMAQPRPGGLRLTLPSQNGIALSSLADGRLLPYLLPPVRTTADRGSPTATDG